MLTFSCLIFSSIELQTQALSLLSYGIQKIPTILVADVDTSTTTAAAGKMKQFFKDLEK